MGRKDWRPVTKSGGCLESEIEPSSRLPRCLGYLRDLEVLEQACDLTTVSEWSRRDSNPRVGRDFLALSSTSSYVEPEFEPLGSIVTEACQMLVSLLGRVASVLHASMDTEGPRGGEHGGSVMAPQLGAVGRRSWV